MGIIGETKLISYTKQELLDLRYTIHKAMSAQWYMNNRDLKLRYQKIYNAKHKRRIKKYRHQYYLRTGV